MRSSQNARTITTGKRNSEIAAPRLIGIIDREAKRIVIALGVGKTALVKDIGPQHFAGRKVRIEELEIGAGDRVPAESRRIAIGEDKAEFGFA